MGNYVNEVVLLATGVHGRHGEIEDCLAAWFNHPRLRIKTIAVRRLEPDDDYRREYERDADRFLDVEKSLEFAKEAKRLGYKWIKA